ncbi:MAG: OST-HTH/LOTUS domain-containing protein, partial [Gemmatimonadaceae bacterium]
WDPWELVTESIGRMTKNGDVMRSDRLKQVMQEIDPSFDEKNAGFSKFSRFVQEASGKGLIKLVKLDNGQLEVAPVAERFPIPRTPARGTAAVSEEREDAAGTAAGNGRRRRGRRGRGVREHEAEGTVESVHGASAPNASEPARKVPLSAIGRSGDRLTKQEAFDLVHRGLESLGNANGGVSARDLRRRAFELLGHDSESLSERMFVHILKDAHDAELIDLRRSGRDYEVESRQKVGDSVAPASVSDSLNRAAAATQHSGPAPSADTAPKTATPVPSAPSTGIGRMGRREVRGAGIRRGVPPADLLLVGVVDHVPTPVATATAQAGGGGGEALVVGSGAGEAVAARPVRAKRGRRVSAAAPKAKRPRRSAAKKETGPKPDAA